MDMFLIVSVRFLARVTTITQVARSFCTVLTTVVLLSARCCCQPVGFSAAAGLSPDPAAQAHGGDTDPEAMHEASG